MDSITSLPKGSAEDMANYLALAARVKFALKNAVEIRIPVSDLRRFEGQPREYFDQDKLKLLSKSIAAGGQTTPGLIRKKPDGKTLYELIDGERRWRAVKMIPEEQQPHYEARLIDAEDDVVQFILSGIANFNREGHTPIETMKTIDRLLSLNIPMSEIATLLGVSQSWAGQIHGLINLAPEIQDKLNPGLPKNQQISVVAAMHISKLPSWPHQRLVAKEVMDGKLPVTRIRSEVIEVASRAGLNIRLRELAPMKQLDAFTSKVGVLDRSAKEIRDILGKEAMQEALAARTADAKSLIKRLESVARDAAWAADRMKKSIGQ